MAGLDDAIAVDEAWIAFEAIVATSHRVDKYGGVRFSTEALTQLADQLNSGNFPMLAQHDRAKPIRTKDVEAVVVTLADGESAVRMVGLAVASDWARAEGAMGFSFTTFESLGRVEGPNPLNPTIRLAADAGWFSDQTIARAAEVISAVAPVEGERLLQFSAFDDARIVLELGLGLVASLGPDLATSAVWDGLKYLLTSRLRRGERAAPTRIEIRTPLPAGEVYGLIDSQDPLVVQNALATYELSVRAAAEAAISHTQVVVWRDERAGGGQWVPPA